MLDCRQNFSFSDFKGFSFFNPNAKSSFLLLNKLIISYFFISLPIPKFQLMIFGIMGKYSPLQEVDNRVWSLVYILVAKHHLFTNVSKDLPVYLQGIF